MVEISKKKPHFSIIPTFNKYLRTYQRVAQLPLRYDDLLRHSDAFPLIDHKGQDTLWETMVYPQHMMQELDINLTSIYAILKTDGDMSVMEHLKVDRIDYCTFGNSNPFRIRIINNFNDNYDYFYVKKADASRVYGLELEHLLSPNQINFLVHQQTLIEEHIAGISGDAFIGGYLKRQDINKVRIAKEFIKFNERCFVRLLGDMRSYNYVIDITPDFDNEQYRVRAIDFDQQCYEGKRRMYLPQFFKENNAIVALCVELINLKTAEQYQQEERTLIIRRLEQAGERPKVLLEVMCTDRISTPEKIQQLGEELAAYHQDETFAQAQRMGDLLRLHLKATLAKVKREKVSFL
ncbi:MAG: hypothetical protein AAF734_06780 [Bacteroidota bacterium]